VGEAAAGRGLEGELRGEFGERRCCWEGEGIKEVQVPVQVELDEKQQQRC
jgi:hypothetical protein